MPISSLVKCHCVLRSQGIVPWSAIPLKSLLWKLKSLNFQLVANNAGLCRLNDIYKCMYINLYTSYIARLNDTKSARTSDWQNLNIFFIQEYIHDHAWSPSIGVYVGKYGICIQYIQTQSIIYNVYITNTSCFL